MSPPPRDDRPSLLVVGSGTDRFGVRSVHLLAMQELAARGWRVALYAIGDGPFVGECRSLGVDVHVAESGAAPTMVGPWQAKVAGLWRASRYRRRAAQELEAYLRVSRCDAMLMSWPNHVAVVGAAARASGCPAYWHMASAVGTSYPLGLNRRIYQHLCHRGGIVPLATSAFTGASLGDRPVKPVVLYLGADEKRFDPDHVEPIARHDWSVPDDAVLTAIVARVTPSKGQHLVIAAMAQLARLGDAGRALHLLVVGQADDPAYVQALADQANAAGMGDRVHILGQLEQPERVFASLDFSINARIDPEPFGLSVIESMMMGVPVMVHALGGPAETVLDGVTGWHVPEPTVEAFANGLRRVLDDRERWPEMRRAARAHALERFGAATWIDRFLHILAERVPAARGAATDS
ncbi:MAG: glycosyltransferase family 4 protein [Phycisphaerales bacterium]|nr:glycosyltransferase family 4 protein [Phycisphaerales bacterium]